MFYLYGEKVSLIENMWFCFLLESRKFDMCLDLCERIKMIFRDDCYLILKQSLEQIALLFSEGQSILKQQSFFVYKK